MSNSTRIKKIKSLTGEHEIDAKYWDGYTIDNIVTINGESIFNNGEDINPQYIEVDYYELINLRDSGELIPGRQYRITDYITTTTIADTVSAGHQFDIIVTADSNCILNEIARACLHEGDTYFSSYGVDLNAWQIWYCLDNDTNRFDWVDVNDGRGVIYRMIDEYNNDCPYDFKNIKFKRNYLSDGGLSMESDGSNRYGYFYTFSWEDDIYQIFDASVFCNHFLGNDGKTGGVNNNIIKSYIYGDIGVIVPKQYLNNIVFYNPFMYNGNSLTGCYSNNFGNNCYNNTFGYSCYSNNFGNNCYNNTFGHSCYNNIFGDICVKNILKANCCHNAFGNNCCNNTFAGSVIANTFGNGCVGNVLGAKCIGNFFGNECVNNIFGANCNDNSLGNLCCYNSFRASASSSAGLINYCLLNHFDDGCSYNVIYNNNTTFSNILQNVNINRGVCGTSESYNYININTLNSNEEINVFNYNGHIYIDNGGIFKVTYSELVSLRDDSKLIPGRKYRITDYVTTTTYTDTISAGHQFDIIVTADDVNTLNEIARACLHEGDTYFSSYCANLNAWQIWYCLDNDNERFFWSDINNGKGVIYRMIDDWNNDSPYDFKNIQFKRSVFTNGLGIFNEKLHSGDEQADAIETVYCYTFTWKSQSGDITDASIVCNFFNSNDGVHDNIINVSKYTDKDGEIPCQYLNNIVFYNTYFANGFIFKGCYSNIFGVGCENISLGNECYGNTFGLECKNIFFSDNCHLNSLGENCHNIIFGDGCTDNTFGSSCTDNTFGSSCYYNTFDSNCRHNTLGTSCYTNTFGISCNNNNLGNSCGINTFGSNCSKINFGLNCDYNIFSNNCVETTLGDECHKNTFGPSCQFNNLGKNCKNNSFVINCYNNTLSEGCTNNSFGNACAFNTLGSYSYHNSFGTNCGHNTFGINFNHNTFGNSCNYNTFGDGCFANSFGNKCEYISFRTTKDISIIDSDYTRFMATGYLKPYISKVHFGDGCSDIVLYANINTSVTNINVAQGLKSLITQPTEAEPNIETIVPTFVEITTSSSNYETMVARNSSGVIKTFCLADFLQ